jgi:predicted RecA/RadA family phage recombinase
MAVTFHDDIGTIAATITGSAVVVGDVNTLGDIIGVAMGSGTDTELTYKVRGLVKGIAKATGTAFVPGESVYHNGTAFAVATATTRSDGYAYADASAGATTCDIVLIPRVSLAVS